VGRRALRTTLRSCGASVVIAVAAASGAVVDVDRLAVFANARPTESDSSPLVGVAAPMVQPALRRDGQADLNGDGHADLLVGGSVDRRNPQAIGWGVSVIYGGPEGLARPGNQLWQESDFIAGPPTRGPVSALVTGDFDGDGYDDLAVGTEEVQLDYEDETFVGEVRIIYGSPQGLVKARSQVWLPSVVDGEVPDSADGYFGSELAAADFGSGLFDDLAIGSSDWGDGRGSLTVLYGSPAGLTSSGAQTWTQDSPGIAGRAVGATGSSEIGDQFGSALAAGPLTGGPYAALAIGAYGDGATPRRQGPGSVTVLYGSAKGLTARGADRWTHASPGIKGRPVESGGFGGTLTIGHFTGRAAADLAVTSSDRQSNGRVNVIRGGQRGLTARGDQLWTTRSLCRSERRYFSDNFAWSLTAGNFGHDAGSKIFDDLAVRGSADLSEDDEGGADTGAVLVLYGSAKGLSMRDHQIWRWDSPGVKGNPTGDDGDGYGDTMTAGNFGRSRFDDLAVADYSVGVGRDGYGAVSVLYGTPNGLTAKGDQLWTVPWLGRTSPRLWAERLADR
jgi:hypothetical protein